MLELLLSRRGRGENRWRNDELRKGSRGWTESGACWLLKGEKVVGGQKDERRLGWLARAIPRPDHVALVPLRVAAVSSSSCSGRAAGKAVPGDIWDILVGNSASQVH